MATSVSIDEFSINLEHELPARPVYLVGRALLFGNVANDIKIVLNDMRDSKGTPEQTVAVWNDFARTLRDLNTLSIEMAEIPVFKDLGKLNPWASIGNDSVDLFLKLSGEGFPALNTADKAAVLSDALDIFGSFLEITGEFAALGFAVKLAAWTLGAVAAVLPPSIGDTHAGGSADQTAPAPLTPVPVTIDGDTATRSPDETLTSGYGPGGFANSDTWTSSGARTGSEQLNADGSTSGITNYANGGKAIDLIDANGNETIDYYNAAGMLTSASWVYSDGSSGSEVFFNNGWTKIPGAPDDHSVPLTYSATEQNPDGSYELITTDKNDNTITTYFSADGSQLSTSTAKGAGKNYDTDVTYKEASFHEDATDEDIVLTIDVATQQVVELDWTFDTGNGIISGTDFGNNSNAQNGKVTFTDGSYATYTIYPAADGVILNSMRVAAQADKLTIGAIANTGLDATVNQFDASGVITSSQWQMADGAFGKYSFSTSASGDGTMTHANGLISDIHLDGLGDITVDNLGSSTGIVSSDWWKADGTHGVTLYSNGTVSTRYTYELNGDVMVEDIASGTTQAETLAAGEVTSGDDSTFVKIVNVDGTYSIDYSDFNGDTLIFNYAGSTLTGTDQVSMTRNPGDGFTGTLSDGTPVVTPYNDTSAVFTEADGTERTIYMDNAGKEIGDDWKATDGSYGSDTFHSDGSGTGMIFKADGTSTSIWQNADGSVDDEFYDAAGVPIGDAWSDGEGAHGSDVTDQYGNATSTSFAADGSNSSATYNANGFLTYASTDDGAGNLTNDYYDGTGADILDWYYHGWTHADGSSGYDYQGNVEIAKGYDQAGRSTNADGSSSSFTVSLDGYTSITYYDAANNLTGTSWSAIDGTHGTTVYGADGTSSATYAADGSFQITVYPDGGGSVTTRSSAAGIALGDTWSHIDGSTGTDVFNADGSRSGTTLNLDGSRTTSVTTAAGVSTSLLYDANGVFTGSNEAFVNAAGHLDVENYDANGAFLSSTIKISTDAGTTATTYAGANGTGAIVGDAWATTGGTSGSDLYDGSGNAIESIVNNGHGATSITLSGNASLSVTGDANADTFIANAGNDTLISGTGSATMNSGNPTGTATGATTFVLGANSGLVVINGGAKDTLYANGVTIEAVAQVNGAWTLFGGSYNGTNYAPAATISGAMGYFTLDGKTSVSFASAMSELSAGGALQSVTMPNGSGYKQVAYGSATLFSLLNNTNSTGLFLEGSNVTGTANGSDSTLTADGYQDTLVGGVGNDTLNMTALWAATGSYSGVMVGGSGATTFNVDNSSAAIGAIEILNTQAPDTLNFTFGPNTYVRETYTSMQLQADGSVLVHLGGLANVDVLIGTTGTYLNEINGYYQATNGLRFLDYTLTLDGLLQQDSSLWAQSAATVTLDYDIVNMTLTGTADIAATGNTLDDIITANSGNDTLIAGIARDTLIGGAGNDTMIAGTGADVFTAGKGHLTIIGAKSTDTLNFGDMPVGDIAITSTVAAGVTTYTLTSSLGGTVVVGSAIGAVSFGINGAFSLAQLLGTAQTVYSDTGGALGAGVSSYTLTGSANLTATGNSLNAIIRANAGNDLLTAGAGLDTLVGGSGNDTLVSGPAINVLMGGSGTTTFIVNNEFDVISAPVDSKNNVEMASVSVTLADNIGVLTGIGSASIALTGNGLTNVITANGGYDTLTGGSGATTLIGGADGGVMQGGSGATVMIDNGYYGYLDYRRSYMYAGTGLTTMIGGTDNSAQFFVNNAADVIIVAAGNSDSEYSSVSLTAAANINYLAGTGTAAIVLTGGATNNTTIVSNGANDTLIAGAGIANLVGNIGDDVFIVNNSADTITSYYAADSTGTDTEETTVSIVAAAEVTNLVGLGNAALTLTGNALNNVITANSGADTLIAGSGNDTLIAGSGIDVLVGGAGNDVFVINSAQDVIQKAANTGWNIEETSVSAVLAANVQELAGIGAGNLLLTGNALGGTIIASAGNDTLVAGGGATTLVGGTGNALLIGNAARGSSAITQFDVAAIGATITIQGTGAGDMLVLTGVLRDMVTATSSIGTVNGIAGQTIITLQLGGDGSVTLDAPAFSSVTFGDGSVATFADLLGPKPLTTYSATSTTLGAGMNRLVLTGSGNVVGTGNDVANALVANSGDDTLVAGTGITTMYGGAGNDLFIVNNAADVIVESANTGHNVEQSAISIALSANVEQLVGTGSAALVLTGASTAGVVIANSGADTLVAGSGVTTLVGGAAGATFQVNAAADVVLGAAGTHNVELATASVKAGANVQVLTDVGQSGITLTGNDLDDLITAGTGYDTLIAGSGADTLVGSVNGSRMIGGSGNDTFVIAGSYDNIVEAVNSGNNTEMTAFSTALALNVQNLVGTGSDNLVLYGNTGSGVITANSGNDTLNAGGGQTTLVAGAGADVLYGNANEGAIAATTYVYKLGDGITTVRDTEAADVLRFGAGITAASVTATSTTAKVNGVSSQVLTLKVAGGTSVVLYAPAFTQVYFADGSTATLAALLANGATLTSAVSATLGTGQTRLVLTGNANITGTGNNLADTIVANSGNDTLIAGSGLATLIGGSGNDTFVINNVGDVISEAANTGNNTEQTSVSVTLAANVQNLTGTGSAALTLTGNTLNNVITANSGADKLVSGSGLDTLVSGTGIDTLVGGTANNVFVVNNAADVITKAANSGSNTEMASVSVTLAANVQNLTGTGTAALTLTGNALNNVITANSGADTLVAGSGLATLIGGSGNNTFVINNAADVITKAVNTGTNIEQSSVSVTLADNVQRLTGTGAAALTLTGNALANIITANSGADTLVAGSGLATLVGGSGSDTFVVNNTGDVITEAANSGSNTELASVSVTLAANVQRLTGTGTAALALTGNTLANIITANSGNDTLTAGSGLATLIGGSGNDTFVVNNVGDVITEAANTGNNTEMTSVSVTLAANVQNLTGTGTAALTLTGNTLNNVITANSGADKLVSGAGLDTLVSGTGIDTLVGGTANNVFVVNNAADVITKAANTGSNTEMTSVSVTLAANVQNLTGTGTAALTLTGNTLNNVITANSGADKLVSGSGLDTLVSGTGIDTLVGGTANNVFIVNNAADVITKATNTGSNTEQASVSVTLATNVQNLMGIGTSALTLTGNTLANIITANSGNDTLVAGAGLATLVGGSGNDTFVINNASDVITEAANSGNNTETTSVSVTLAANVQNLTGTGTAALTLTGNTLNNVITANSGADKLVAGSGLDTLVSGTGIDTLVGGTANNVFVINNAADVITKATNTGSNTEQASVSVTLAANVQNLTGIGTNALTLTGNALNDVITGNSGNDTLVAGSGTDTLIGNAGGNYTVSVGAASDTVLLGDGSNNIVSTEAAANSESFQVGNGVNHVTLGSGTDHVTLGNGVDTVTTKAGTDTLTLGTGQYTLSNTGATENAVLTTGGESQLWFEQVGNNLQIDVLGSSELITVANWFTTGTKLNQLTTSDGHVITAAGIGQLVQAMATFGAPAAGQSSYTLQEQTALAPVLAANWR